MVFVDKLKQKMMRKKSKPPGKILHLEEIFFINILTYKDTLSFSKTHIVYINLISKYYKYLSTSIFIFNYKFLIYFLKLSYDFIISPFLFLLPTLSMSPTAFSLLNS